MVRGSPSRGDQATLILRTVWSSPFTFADGVSALSGHWHTAILRIPHGAMQVGLNLVPTFTRAWNPDSSRYAWQNALERSD